MHQCKSTACFCPQVYRDQSINHLKILTIMNRCLYNISFLMIVLKQEKEQICLNKYFHHFFKKLFSYDKIHKA